MYVHIQMSKFSVYCHEKVPSVVTRNMSFTQIGVACILNTAHTHRHSCVNTYRTRHTKG